jgi:hypothetical protein
MSLGGSLEREIRLLPQVLACQLSDAECVVLVHPSGDPTEVERAVRAILGRHGKTGLSLRVFGGAERPAAVIARPPIGALALIGSLVGGAALTAAVIFGNISSPPKKQHPPIGAPPAIVTPVPRGPSHVSGPPVVPTPEEPAVPAVRSATRDATPPPPRPRPAPEDKPVVPGPKPEPEPNPQPGPGDDDDVDEPGTPDAEDDLGQADDEDDHEDIDDDDGDDADEIDDDDDGENHDDGDDDDDDRGGNDNAHHDGSDHGDDD